MSAPRDQRVRGATAGRRTGGLTAPRASVAIPTAILTAGIGLACDSSRGGAGSDATIRDSAGVTIVENHADPSSLPAWRLSPEPTVRIGSLEGPPEHQFFRISSATRLDGGRLAVANAGSHEIRIFEPDGAFVRAFGGEGDGPAQFQIPSTLGARGDTLHVFDRGLLRTARWSVDGELLGVHDLDGKGGREPFGRFGDGSLLMAELRTPPPRDGLNTFALAFHHVDRDGRWLAEIAEYPWMDYVMIPDVGGAPPHFGARTVAVAHVDGVVVGTGNEYEIEMLTAQGDLSRLVRWNGPPRDVTDAHVRTLRETTLSALAGEADRRAGAERFDAFPVADRLPSLTDIGRTRDGRILVREFSAGAVAGWLVFAPEGTLEARFDVPDDVRMLEVGADYVLGVATDELGVEYLVVHELVRS